MTARVVDHCRPSKLNDRKQGSCVRTLVLKEPAETSLDVRLDERPGWEFVNIDHDNDLNVVLSSTFPFGLRSGVNKGIRHVLIYATYLAPSTGHGFIRE